MPEVPLYWTVRELAGILGLTTQTVRNHCRAGKIDATYVGEWKISPMEAARVLHLTPTEAEKLRANYREATTKEEEAPRSV